MKDEKLKEIDKEDFIWIIFIILFLFKLYSNNVEREYRINNNMKSRKKYHDINTFTLIVALIISIYYIYCNLKEEETNLVALICNVLSAVIIVVFIYYEITDED